METIDYTTYGVGKVNRVINRVYDYLPLPLKIIVGLTVGITLALAISLIGIAIFSPVFFVATFF